MKKYLVIFKLPMARIEHAQIKKDLEQYSSGDVQIAFSSVAEDRASLIGFLFTSAAPLKELTFDGHLFYEDSYLLVELGTTAASSGFGDAYGWLQGRRHY